MRWVSFIVRLAIRLGGFLAAKAIFILFVIAVSLSFSMASFVVPALASTMWRVAASVLGPPVVATVTETRRLQGQNQALLQKNQDLALRNRGLDERSRVLSSRNQDLEKTNTRRAETNRILSAQNQRLKTSNSQINDQLSTHRRATNFAARRIGNRAVRTSARSIAAIPLESVPVLGITTIIATTAWEIHDTCETLDDMAGIQRHLGQEPDKSFAAQACDKVPLQGARVVHYGDMPVSECRANAEDARDRVLELAEQARDDMPDLVVDESSFDAEIVKAANDEFLAISDICNCIADLLCDPEDLAKL